MVKFVFLVSLFIVVFLFASGKVGKWHKAIFYSPPTTLDLTTWAAVMLLGVSLLAFGTKVVVDDFNDNPNVKLFKDGYNTFKNFKEMKPIDFKID